MTYLLVQVIGRRAYRNHHVGDHIVVKEDDSIRRGIARGNLRVITEVQRRLRDFGFPRDWPPTRADAAHTEAPEGASLIAARGGKK